jgi:hypothetical protein
VCTKFGGDPWRIKIKSVRIPVAIVQFKVEIHFAVINVVSKVPENPAHAAIRVVVIIKFDGRASARPYKFIAQL